MTIAALALEEIAIAAAAAAVVSNLRINDLRLGSAPKSKRLTGD
jgi:hypothetical protein